MSKRNIIKINEDLCNGCGNCIVGCAESALELVNGKAKIVKESLCDGLGACIGKCPTGALTIEVRDAAEYSEEEVKEKLAKEAKPFIPQNHGAHGHAHAHGGGGCPGSRMRDLKNDNSNTKAAPAVQLKSGEKFKANQAELQQWPVQLHLVRPDAPYFSNKEMVVLSTCSPIASADVHWRFIRGRSVVVACPKLDNLEGYVEKLAEIFKNKSIPKVNVVVMEVPCCGGLARLVKDAIARSGRTDLEYHEHIVTLDGFINS